MRLGNHEYFTAREAARRLGVAVSSIQSRARARHLHTRLHPYFLVRLYRKIDLERIFKRQLSAPTDVTISRPVGRMLRRPPGQTIRGPVPQTTSAIPYRVDAQETPIGLFTMRRVATISIILAAVGLGTVRLFSLGISDAQVAFLRSPEDSDHVVVKFQSPITEAEAKARFTIEPDIQGDFAWIEQDQELHFVPYEGFNPQVSYRVSVKLRSPLFASLGASTARLAFVAPKETTAKTTFDLTPPAQGKALDINLATMTATLLENGEVVQIYPILGKGNPWLTPTREGNFRITQKKDRNFSTIYKVWQPYNMRYSGPYSIHGVPYWPNGQRLTSVYSGGCIRLQDDIAKAVYEWVDIGTPVIVHSTPGRTPLVISGALGDGTLVREDDDAAVYVVKVVGEKRFRRHVLTEKFAEWYPHLSPFWKKVQTTHQGTLETYRQSRWVWTQEPSDAQGNRFIYEIREPGTKHLMQCAESPGSAVVDPKFCASSWEAHGWDLDEIFVVSPKELAFYREGERLTLPSAPSLTATRP